MLFTHFGLSGPLILTASTFMRDWDRHRYTLHINMKPALSLEEMDARLLRDISASPNKALRNILALMMHAVCVPVVLERLRFDGGSPGHSVTRQQRREIVRVIQDFTFTPTAMRTVEEAIATAGGVAVNEVDPKTMQSKIVEGLYFAGEVLDVDAQTGGYNLQIAWSTGYAAGCAAGNLRNE
jgi:hypothetical protein